MGPEPILVLAGAQPLFADLRCLLSIHRHSNFVRRAFGTVSGVITFAIYIEPGVKSSLGSALCFEVACSQVAFAVHCNGLWKRAAVLSYQVLASEI